MKVSVGYIPNEKVIGLSKIARIAEMVGKRLQLQERIAMDITDVIEMATDSKDIAVIVEGEHSCMTSRGVKKPGSVTKTTVFRGEFDKKDSLRQEFLLLL
jgi:GTP cyclohydrolase I